MKKNQAQKKSGLCFSKKGIVIGSICFSIILVLISVGLFFLLPDKTESSGDSDSIYYYPAKYDEDIFNNQAYLEFERDLLYSASGVTKEYRLVEDKEIAPVECRFFLDYFDAVIRGNVEDYKNFFDAGYFKSEPEFTMQMIYEPYVMFHSVSEEDLNGETLPIYNFEVRYRIFKNNGTFRQGVASNQAVPQIYRLVKRDDTYKIFQILDVEYED